MKRFSLSRAERLTGRKEIALLFEKGRHIFSSDQRIRAVYYLSAVENQIQAQKAVVKFAAVVPKKKGCAVWRNRVRRLLKNAYRQKKHILYDAFEEQGKSLSVIMSPNRLSEKSVSKIAQADVLPAVEQLLYKIVNK